MGMGSAVEAGQRWKGRACLEPHLFRTVPKLNHLTDFQERCTENRKIVSFCAPFLSPSSDHLAQVSPRAHKTNFFVKVLVLISQTLGSKGLVWRPHLYRRLRCRPLHSNALSNFKIHGYWFRD